MLLEVVMVVEMVARRGVRKQTLEQPQGNTEQVGLS